MIANFSEKEIEFDKRLTYLYEVISHLFKIAGSKNKDDIELSEAREFIETDFKDTENAMLFVEKEIDYFSTFADDNLLRHHLAIIRDISIKEDYIRKRQDKEFRDFIKNNLDRFFIDFLHIDLAAPEEKQEIPENRRIGDPHNQESIQQFFTMVKQMIEAGECSLTLPKRTKETRLEYREYGYGVYNKTKNKIFINPKLSWNSAKLLILHELTHAIHYNLIDEQKLLPSMCRIATYGYSSATKEGIAVAGTEILIAMLSDDVLGECFLKDLEYMKTRGRIEREVLLGDLSNLDKTNHSEHDFLEIPGYRTAYMSGYERIKKLLETNKMTDIMKMGFVSLDVLEANLTPEDFYTD